MARRATRNACLAGGVLLLALTLGACGAGRALTSPVVAVQIGRATITTSAVAHRMGVLAPEHYVPDAPSFRGCVRRSEMLEPESVRAGLLQECRRDYEALKQRALAFLISSRWRIGERAEAHMHVEETVTQAEVASYYRRHISRYVRPAVRYADVLEHIPTAAAASRLRQEFATGRKSLASPVVHHVLYTRRVPNAIPGQAAFAKAIFAAKLHVLSGVVPFDRLYAFFEVTRVAPAVARPLKQVQGSIKAAIAAQARMRSAEARWEKWIARTDCRPGYVVEQCRQYEDVRR
jgi:hypothetical protein